MTNKFLIDANSFIAPYKQFYPFDFASNFWGQLELEISAGNLLILDLVKKEILKGDDDLSIWVKKFDKPNVLSHKEPAIIQRYGEVITHIQSSGLYKEKALKAWADADIADPWLIATASVHNYTIITFETSNGNLSVNSPSGSPKIPDVCEPFSVSCENLYYMMRQLSFTL